jgi:hypothetical protein
MKMSLLRKERHSKRPEIGHPVHLERLTEQANTEKRRDDFFLELKKLDDMVRLLLGDNRPLDVRQIDSVLRNWHSFRCDLEKATVEDQASVYVRIGEALPMINAAIKSLINRGLMAKKYQEFYQELWDLYYSWLKKQPKREKGRKRKAQPQRSTVFPLHESALRTHEQEYVPFELRKVDWNQIEQDHNPDELESPTTTKRFRWLGLR